MKSQVQALWQSRFPSFLLVGLLNTLMGYLLFSLFIYLDFPYAFAVLLATVLGVLFNYQTTGRLVFKNRGNHLLLKFILAYGILYFLNIMLIKCAYVLVSNYYTAGALVTPIMAVINFLTIKKFVFNEAIHEIN